MNTAFLLMAQYEGRAIVTIEEVCRDYFRHLTPEKFIRKVDAGDIEIPMVRMEQSQKAGKGIHLTDLAAYLDKQRDKALEEYRKLHRIGQAGKQNRGHKAEADYVIRYYD